jgi:hypothetical protein
MTSLPSYPSNLVADDLLSCALRLYYGLLPFLGLLAFAPAPIFLFVPALMLALPRPALLLPPLILVLAMLLLDVVDGVEVLVLVEGVALELLEVPVRFALPFPLFALSAVQAIVETRSVNTARAKIFLIIVSFKAAASVRGEIGKHPDRSIYHTLLRKS